MIRFKLAGLIEKRQFELGSRVTIQEVAAQTGINRMTLSKILNQRGYSTGTDVLDKICTYFECPVEDLIEHLPDAPAGDHAVTGEPKK